VVWCVKWRWGNLKIRTERLQHLVIIKLAKISIVAKITLLALEKDILLHCSPLLIYLDIHIELAHKQWNLTAVLVSLFFLKGGNKTSEEILF